MLQLHKSRLKCTDNGQIKFSASDDSFRLVERKIFIFHLNKTGKNPETYVISIKIACAD